MTTQNKQKTTTLLQLRHLILQHQLKTERLESHTIANKMLAHRFDPVQSQTVQHGARALHDDQDADGQDEPKAEEEEDADDAGGAFELESVGERHGPEHDGKLLVSKGEGPETEIRGGVGNTVEAKF